MFVCVCIQVLNLAFLAFFFFLEIGKCQQKKIPGFLPELVKVGADPHVCLHRKVRTPATTKEEVIK